MLNEVDKEDEVSIGLMCRQGIYVCCVLSHSMRSYLFIYSILWGNGNKCSTTKNMFFCLKA